MDQAMNVATEIFEEPPHAVDEAFNMTMGQGTSNLVLLAKASDSGTTMQESSGETFPAGAWPGLLARVQGAARYMREVEDRAQEQEFHVQELLEQVRTSMQAARAQVQAAEQQARNVQLRALGLIKAADERARVAEEKAAASERMLLKISETIESEFVTQPPSQMKGASVAGHRPYAARAAS